MSESESGQDSILANDQVIDARRRLDAAIHDYGKDLRMRFGSVPGTSGPVPVPDPNDLIKIIGEHQSMLMDLKREIVVMGVIVKVMTLFVDDSVRDDIARLTSEAIVKHAKQIEKFAKEKRENEKKSSIITDVNPAMASKINNASKRADFGNN